jgi:hypothetical protein
MREAMYPSSILEAARSLTEGLSYSYKIPGDREKRLYDFYLLNLYKSFMENQNYAKRLQTLPGVDDDTVKDLEAIVQDGSRELGAEIRDDLLAAIVTAVSSEFRHIVDSNTHIDIEDFMKDKGVFENFKKWMRSYHRSLGQDKVPYYWNRPTDRKNQGSNKSYTAASKATKSSGWDLESFMNIAMKAFKSLNWGSSYGGKRWADIAKSWFKLKNAPEKEWPIWIDHVFDLEHNTGTMLNKVKRFGKDGNYSWIKKALDAKFSMTPIQLARASSIPMSIVGRLNRITGVSGTVQDHDGKKKGAEKDAEKDVKKDTEKKKSDIKAIIRSGVYVFKDGDGFGASIRTKPGHVEAFDIFPFNIEEGALFVARDNGLKIKSILVMPDFFEVDFGRSSEIYAMKTPSKIESFKHVVIDRFGVDYEEAESFIEKLKKAAKNAIKLFGNMGDKDPNRKTANSPGLFSFNKARQVFETEVQLGGRYVEKFYVQQYSFTNSVIFQLQNPDVSIKNIWVSSNYFEVNWRERSKTYSLKKPSSEASLRDVFGEEFDIEDEQSGQLIDKLKELHQYIMSREGKKEWKALYQKET